MTQDWWDGPSIPYPPPSTQACEGAHSASLGHPRLERCSEKDYFVNLSLGTMFECLRPHGTWHIILLTVDIQIFREAISENVAITCDFELDKKKLKKVKLYPMVMDYFATTDKVDAIVYYEDNDEIRHIDFNTVSNVKITKDKKDLNEKYQNWRKEDYKTTTFEIVPKMFAIDRIVRMFSNYKRQVEYNPENETYKMTIEYSKNDYANLQRDILSAGEYIVVLEPFELKELIHERIKKANGNYK